MRLVLLGPPGAGKGTQAAKLAAYLGVPHISTGNILRHNVAQGTDLGKKAKAYMEAGQLRADDREDVVRKRIETYERQTAPLIKYYRDRALLREVYASGLIEEIFLRAIEVLKESVPSRER